MHSRWPVHEMYIPAVQFVQVACAALVAPIGPTLPAGHSVPEHDVAVLQEPLLYRPDGHTAHALQ